MKDVVKDILNIILGIVSLFMKIMEFVFGDIGVINDAHRPDRW